MRKKERKKEREREREKTLSPKVRTDVQVSSTGHLSDQYAHMIMRLSIHVSWTPTDFCLEVSFHSWTLNQCLVEDSDQGSGHIHYVVNVYILLHTVTALLITAWLVTSLPFVQSIALVCVCLVLCIS